MKCNLWHSSCHSKTIVPSCELQIKTVRHCQNSPVLQALCRQTVGRQLLELPSQKTKISSFPPLQNRHLLETQKNPQPLKCTAPANYWSGQLTFLNWPFLIPYQSNNPDKGKVIFHIGTLAKRARQSLPMTYDLTQRRLESMSGEIQHRVDVYCTMVMGPKLQNYLAVPIMERFSCQMGPFFACCVTRHRIALWKLRWVFWGIKLHLHVLSCVMLTSAHNTLLHKAMLAPLCAMWWKF